MDVHEKLTKIQERLEEIAAQIEKLKQTILRIQEENERQNSYPREST